MDGRLKGKLLYALLCTFFILLIALPLLYLIASSFTENGSLTLVHYAKVYNFRTFSLLLKSCTVAFIVALTATFIGGLFGFMLSRTDIPYARWLKLLLLLPLFVSPYYLAVAWRDFVFVINGNTAILKSEKAVGAILLMCYTPVSILIMSASFANINSKLEQAGLLVTNRLQTLWHIVFPLVKPAIISSFVLVFILTISEITVCSYFVVHLLPNELFVQFTAFYDHKAAIAIGSLVCILSIVLLLTERNYLTDAPFLTIGKKGSSVKNISLGNWKYILLLLTLLYLCTVVIIPLVVLGMHAFKEGMPEYLRDRRSPGGYLPLDRELGYTLDFIRQGFALLKPVILDSVLYAFAGSVLSCLLGFTFAYHSERKKAKWMDYILLLAFAIPSAIFGIALVKFYNRPVLEFIYSSAFIILIGYIGKFTFVSSRIIGNSIKQIPFSFEEAAQLAGAGLMSRIWNIVFPLLFKGFFTAFIICFIFCLGEIATTIVVYPPGKSLLPIKIATSMHNTPESLISAMVLLVLIITFSSLAVLFFFQNMISKKYSYDDYTA